MSGRRGRPALPTATARPTGCGLGLPQQRYLELTGWKPPHAGGPRREELTPEQREADHAARLVISREMGHNREEITAVYLGR